jgi:A/G-specific adenine glycosylase
MALGSNRAVLFRRKLLRWYDRQHRDLPWRRARDPYRIWLSEVMLQQTRVPAAIPYYERFLEHFPDVGYLAKASEDEVLALWSGLGYYARARNLQRAAQVILEKYSGQFPRELKEARALPGVGRYTAAAVLSIAYQVPLPVLDGNVARVLSRLYAHPYDARKAKDQTRMLERGYQLLSKRRPGDFNQAMMELGATVCLPREPRCPMCPMRRGCLAHLRGEVEDYPPRREKNRVVVRQFVAAIVPDGSGKYLMVRRSGRARWMPGFWELPMWETATPQNSFSEMRRHAAKGVVLDRYLGKLRHTITENRLEVAVCLGSMLNGNKLPGARWIDPTHVGRRCAITTITRKALSRLGASVP